jgi:hypothetical protein
LAEDQKPTHKHNQSKETGGIEVMANLEEYSDCSHNNLSGRENKSEIEAHHLSFSDNENKKKRYKTNF